ncbi:MAG: hypothetical protein E3J78_08655, partial [Candidatus Cloacimonadota bacterium]
MKNSMNSMISFNLFEKVMGAFTIAMILLVTVESGFLVQFPGWLHLLGIIVSMIFIVAGVFEFLYHLFASSSKRDYLKSGWWNFIFFFFIFLTLKNIEASRFLGLIREIFFLLMLFSKRQFFRDFFAQPYLRNPTRLLSMSFLTIILLGSILLTFPVSSEIHQRTGIVDAVFTATSATCVTGLIVKDTSNHWSTFGEIIILLLIQAGGLGIMTFSISIALVFGARLGLREKKTMGEILELSSVGDVGRIIKFILRFTFIAEGIGVILLFIRWLPYFGNAKKAFYHSVFHSISAFCNAGFSLFSTSLKGFISDPVINIVMMLLIVVGGIGFVVIFDLFRKGNFIREGRFRAPKLTVHTKLVIIVSMMLIFARFIFF